MSRKWKDILIFVSVSVVLLLANMALRGSFTRWDLTEERRYSLSSATVDLIQQLDERILVKVYLKGDFPPGFQKLQRETQNLLDELQAYNSNLLFQFIDPSDQASEKDKQEVYQQLRSKGLMPFQLETNEPSGKRTLNVFPGALISRGEREIAVNILQAQMGERPEAQMNASIEKLEYTLAQAIRKLNMERKARIAFIEGHGELNPRYLADLGRSLSEHYTVDRFNLREFAVDSITGEPSVRAQLYRLNTYDLAFIAKPMKGFSDLDLYLLDQFIMGGGKCIWALDMVLAEMDSLSSRSDFLALPLDERLRLRNSLFRYGVRVNTDLVQDLLAAGLNDSREVLPWAYSPMVMPYIDHPVTKDLNGLRLEFSSSIDTLIAPGIKKTVLLQSSPRSARFNAPHQVSLATLYQSPDAAILKQGPLPLAVLLEGRFASAFVNRVQPRGQTGQQLPMQDSSLPTQMLVIADGDIAKNQLNLMNPQIPKGVPLPLGFDQFTGAQYGNKEFMLNAFDYLLDDSGLMELRARELKIRLLDSQRRQDERSFWIAANTGIPLGVLLFFSIGYAWIRKRLYAR